MTTPTDIRAAAVQAREALSIALGAITMMQPCAADDCKAEQAEWKDAAEHKTRAALAALDAALTAAPAPMPGWKLVPVEPTPEMEQAGNDASDWHVRDADDIYRAMLAASQQKEPKP